LLTAAFQVFLLRCSKSELLLLWRPSMGQHRREVG
jgi:hypothetical protein